LDGGLGKKAEYLNLFSSFLQGSRHAAWISSERYGWSFSSNNSTAFSKCFLLDLLDSDVKSLYHTHACYFSSIAVRCGIVESKRGMENIFE